MNIWSTPGWVIMRMFHGVSLMEDLSQVQLEGAMPQCYHDRLESWDLLGRGSQVPEFHQSMTDYGFSEGRRSGGHLQANVSRVKTWKV